MTALTSPLRADDSAFRQRASEAATAKDDKSFASAVAEWKAKEPSSPEPYIVEANRLVAKAREIEINTGDPGPGDLPLTDPKTGELKGRLGPGGPADKALMGQALDLLKQGQALAPDRLDIRTGMAFLCQESERFDEQLEILRAMVKRARENPSRQTWIKSEAIKEPLDGFVAEKLHSFALFHYRKESAEGDKHFGAICRLAVDQYPDSPVAWNDMALFRYFAEKDTKAAAKCLEKASRLDPADLVVQFNLAKFYAELKEPAKAEALYRSIMEKHPGSEDARKAETRLKELKNPPGGKKTDGDF